MKLNPDCVRDILMSFEEATTPGNPLVFQIEGLGEKFERLREYAGEELAYHISQCNMNGFLYQLKRTVIGEYQITDITPKAHEFLANIRSDTVWNGVKGVAAKVGSKSLDALIQIASNVITELIRAQFNLS